MTKLKAFDVLITAQEAYPALERAVIGAKDRIDMGFRVFDPRTALLSRRAREIGDTWVDLLVAKLDEGVRISISLTDFDPVVRAEMHAGTWKALRVLQGIAEMSKNPNLMQARVYDHPARVGWAPRLVLWTKIMDQLRATCSWLGALDLNARKDVLRSMPRLQGMVCENDDGSFAPVQANIPPMIPVTHHQKVAVIDDRWLYIGGLDLDRRRLDSPEHKTAAAQTWHDVQAILHDPDRARAARIHLDRFQRECAGECAVRPPAGLLRTLSVRRTTQDTHLSPRVCDTSILDAHLDQISKAEQFIYLESQFLRDPVLTDALVERAETAPDLGIVVMLPAAPLEVAFDHDEGLDMRYGEYMQAQMLTRLQDAYGTRLFIGSPGQLRASTSNDRAAICGAPMVFIHSKVSVFDNRSAMITSANHNGRSMRWDTELGIEVTDPEQVEMVRKRVMGTWLPDNAPDRMTEPGRKTVGLWRSLAQQNANTDPAERRGFVLPHDVEASVKFGQLLPGVPVEMV